MSLKFEPTSDGYFASDAISGRGIARIETKRTEQVRTTQPPDNRVVFLEQIVTLPREQWQVHFCAGKRTIAELQAVIAEMPAE